jgi:hypothetical protein
VALANVTARNGTFDASVLSAFSTDQARIGGVQAAVMGMAQRDPDAARQLVEARVTEQPHRDRMLSMITQMSSMRGRMPGGAVPFIGPGYFPPGMMNVPTIGMGGPTPAGVNQAVIVSSQENSSGPVGLRVERVAPAPAPPATR